MDFVEVIEQAKALLQSKGRMTYRALKYQFQLDDEGVEALKEELIEGERVATDENARVLVWTGGEIPEETAAEVLKTPRVGLPSSALSAQPGQEAPAGERRQLTVMFCDVVGSTSLSEQLDPEDLHHMVRLYQHTCAEVITRYEGHIAQYLGDGLLVYFGFPAAHEDDASRAIRTSLEILDRLPQLETAQPLHVRIGIHTGLVVVGEVGEGGRREHLALGETPNIAARVQGQAQPDEVVISAATQQLVAGLFETEDCGVHALKGISTPQTLYRVRMESAAQSRFEAAVQQGLTPLVGRAEEVEFLRQRWTHAQAGNGQAVLVSGEPGIGKSRLVQELKAHVTAAGATPIEFRCSPYHQNSALYPLIEHLQRLLQFTPDDTPATKLDKLQQLLERYRFPQENTLALLAALLLLPYPTGVPPLAMSRQKQKELTQAALVAWLIEETEQQPVYNAWEDLHWADPSTLEVLDLLLTQVPTSSVLAVLTFRPEFVPPWGTRSYLSQLPLGRLGQPQVSALVGRMTAGKALPEEVIEQIVTKTDGVPLFVEELTKMVLESGILRAVNAHYELTQPLATLTIPSTLHDSLMARLDQLGTGKEVAQLGATIGREFSYELLQAVSSLDAPLLQQGLHQLVAAELVFQRGLPPQAHYLFKHALIQDTAYQSLLKRIRQRYHQQIAEALVDRFPETREQQLELVAHHYTEAGLVEQALPYWQQAGERAAQHSANVEAVSHLTTGLAALQTLPDTPERDRHELVLQVALGVPLTATKSWAAPEVGNVYMRAQELCEEVGDTSELFPVLWGVWGFSLVRAEHKRAHELGEQMLRLAQSRQDPALLVEAHYVMGNVLFYRGEQAPARTHLEQGITLYDSQHHHSLAFLYGAVDPGVSCLGFATEVLWQLGYPEQALKRSHEALSLAHKLSHPFSQAYALDYAARLHQFRRERQAVQDRAEAVIPLSTEQGFPFWLAWGTSMRGWALAEQGQSKEGIAQIREGLAAMQATGAEVYRSYFLALLAEMHGKVEQAEEGLRVVEEALAFVERTEERFYEAELYRLKGEIVLQAGGRRPELEAEGCFHQAIDIARRQSAKSLELRASMSLALLWQQQGKSADAYQLLSEIYNWFTEGFDTPDLKDAKALLDELS